MIVVLKCFQVLDFVHDSSAVAAFSYETVFNEESETAPQRPMRFPDSELITILWIKLHESPDLARSENQCITTHYGT